MSAPLAPCPSCSRHVLVTEPACPFCAVALDGLAPATFDPLAAPRRVAHLALAVGASLALGACPSPSAPANVYGAPPPTPAPRVDASAPRAVDAPAPTPTPPAPAPMPPGTVNDDGSRSEIYGAPPRPR